MNCAQGDPMQKAVFLLVMLGKELNTRVRKIISTYSGTIYEGLPTTRNDFEKEIHSLRQEIEDEKTVLRQTETQIQNVSCQL